MPVKDKLAAIGFWLLVALLVFGLSAPLFVIGGHVTIIEINTSGRFLILAPSVVAGFWAVVALIRDSRSGSPYFSLESLRRLRPGAWSIRILGSAGVVAVAVGISAWMWVQVLIRLSPGEPTLSDGEVVGVIRTGARNQFCRYLVDVKLSQDSQLNVCAEFGLTDRTTLPELTNLEKGDAVRIAIRATALGKTAEIVGRQTSHLR